MKSSLTIVLTTALSLSLTLGPNLALAAPAATEPPPDETTVSQADKSEAEKLSGQAIVEFNAKNYDKAVELFEIEVTP